jgi:hypothetical protein
MQEDSELSGPRALTGNQAVVRRQRVDRHSAADLKVTRGSIFSPVYTLGHC